ncbi:MAG: PQQ-like beta-propeller repeat protein [Acidimicrobiia bacterium]|nr:PQQ-like beta-propeller repeat protein [Acidimicrobiia bacterium]
MNGHDDDEVLAHARIRRNRSPLFVPLVLLSAVVIGLVGYRTVVPLLNQEAATPVQDAAEDAADPDPWQCRSAVARAEQLDEAHSTPVALPMLMARSQAVVSGRITDGLLYDDYGVAVVEVEPIDGIGDETLERLLLPLSSVPSGAPWQGADFVAFLSGVSEFGVGTVVPGGFFFACGYDEPATGLARFDPEYETRTRTLSALLTTYLEFQQGGYRQETNVIAPRIHVLDLVEEGQGRIGLYLPERLGAPFDVYSIDTPGEGRWHLVFANDTVVGRIGIGPCGDRDPDHCSGDVRMEIEGLSGVKVPAALEFLGGPTADGFQSAFGAPVVEARFGPQVIDDLLVYLNGDAIFAVDKLTLEPRWQRGGGPFSFARVGPGQVRIVVRSEIDGALTGMNRAGAIEWRSEVGGTVASRLLTGGPILVQSWLYPDMFNRRGLLVALDPSDGSRLWDFSRDVPMAGAVRTVERTSDSLYVVEITTESPLATSKEFIGLEMATGEVRWRVDPQPGGGVFERDGYLWWAGGGRIARIDGDSGAVLWQVDRAGIDNLTVEGAVVDLGEAGSFDLESGRRLRDTAVSPCC